MSRADLPAGFEGWQAVDATPQEESPQGGGYRTGPAPIKAVKEGNSVVYDANFVIAEVHENCALFLQYLPLCLHTQVNADIKRYMVDSDGVPRLVSVDTSSVGRDISTKAVGSNRREDLTNAVSPSPVPLTRASWLPLSLQYKHPEGSDWERRALYHGYEELLKETHEVTFSIPQAKYSFGQNVTLRVSSGLGLGEQGSSVVCIHTG